MILFDLMKCVVCTWKANIGNWLLLVSFLISPMAFTRLDQTRLDFIEYLLQILIFFLTAFHKVFIMTYKNIYNKIRFFKGEIRIMEK